MTSQLLSTLKQKITGFELEPSDGGCFEVTVDGKLVYSKLSTGEFPNEESVVGEIVGMS